MVKARIDSVHRGTNGGRDNCLIVRPISLIFDKGFFYKFNYRTIRIKDLCSVSEKSRQLLSKCAHFRNFFHFETHLDEPEFALPKNNNKVKILV